MKKHKKHPAHISEVQIAKDDMRALRRAVCALMDPKRREAMKVIFEKSTIHIENITIHS